MPFRRTHFFIIHSSAGIGRTGCFIALSNGIKQLDQEHSIDIVRILCDLRRDRGGMIQTNDQYQFVYQALSEYARTLPLNSWWCLILFTRSFVFEIDCSLFRSSLSFIQIFQIIARCKRKTYSWKFCSFFVLLLLLLLLLLCCAHGL